MTSESSNPSTRSRCRHIFTDGHRCGSVTLRKEYFCYYHHTSRPPVQNLRERRALQEQFDLPNLEDRSAIQFAIGEVLRRIAANALDPRRAGLLLYGLQIAALNLPKQAALPPQVEEDKVSEVIDDPVHGLVAPAAPMPDPAVEVPGSEEYQRREAEGLYRNFPQADGAVEATIDLQASSFLPCPYPAPIRPVPVSPYSAPSASSPPRTPRSALPHRRPLVRVHRRPSNLNLVPGLLVPRIIVHGESRADHRIERNLHMLRLSRRQ